MPNHDLEVEHSEAVNDYCMPIIAGVFLSAMMYCAQKLWKARHSDVLSVRCVFLLLTIFFGFKGLHYLNHLLGIPMFLAGIFGLWPKFIHVTVVEVLASAWLKVSYQFSVVKDEKDRSNYIKISSAVVNISVHSLFFIEYSTIFFIFPEYTGDALLIFLVLFSGYTIGYMVFSVYRITRTIDYYLESRANRKIKMIGALCFIDFAFNIAVNILVLEYGRQAVMDWIVSVGIWFAIVTFLVNSLLDLLFMLIISRAIDAQQKKPDDAVVNHPSLTEDLANRSISNEGSSFFLKSNS